MTGCLLWFITLEVLSRSYADAVMKIVMARDVSFLCQVPEIEVNFIV